MADQESTKWHELLGTLLKYLLSPVGIKVSTDFNVMSKSPEVDILLLRRFNQKWTAEQLALLPDGIRDCQASEILLEFKYTESFNEDAIQQAIGYDFLYKRYNVSSKEKEKVQTFLLSAQKPQLKTLTRFGYERTEHEGVYRSSFELVRKIVLLSLNELTNEPHNAFVKCFSSREKEKQKAFNTLKQKGFNSFTDQLQWFLAGLNTLLFSTTGEPMKIQLTPEMVTKMGKEWGQVYLSSLPAEKRLAGLTPKDRLAGLKPKDRLAGLTPKELDELANELNRLQRQKTGV